MATAAVSCLYTQFFTLFFRGIASALNLSVVMIRLGAIGESAGNVALLTTVAAIIGAIPPCYGLFQIFQSVATNKDPCLAPVSLLSYYIVLVVQPTIGLVPPLRFLHLGGRINVPRPGYTLNCSARRRRVLSPPSWSFKLLVASLQPGRHCCRFCRLQPAYCLVWNPQFDYLGDGGGRVP
jgi:hypothetical protein